ncbi:FkbM family methyltransferase, partial [Kineococcus indalonis]|uniref:FkbM family methyltransferase n=1 Tax=Kineococcus indalonis TaxID=2696566 RepID=UPI00141281BD
MRLPTPGEQLIAGRSLSGSGPTDETAVGQVRVRPRAVTGPLRIAVLVPRTDVGGGARVLFEHANRLAARGHDVVVLAHHPAPRWFPLSARFEQVPVGLDLADAVPPCDLITCGYWDQVLSAAVSHIAPVLHFEQGDAHLFEDLTPASFAKVQKHMAAADAHVTVSTRVQRILGERFGVEAGVLPNAIDPAVFHPRTTPAPGDRYVLCVGWDGNEFKGMGEARRVADALATTHPDVRVVWVTPRPPLEPFGTVVVAPPQQVLAELYRDAAVYLCTSHYESFPLPPLEAMASGTPVVSTDNTGVLEYARDGENLLLAPVRDVRALHAALARVLDEDGTAEALRDGGLRTARRFNWDAIVDELEALCREVAGRGAGAGGDAPWGDAWDDRRNTGTVPATPQDAALLEHVLARSGARSLLAPVSRPAFPGHELVQWQVVAGSRAGGRGEVRVHALHTTLEPPAGLPHQAGIDAFVREDMSRALEHFLRTWDTDERRSVRGAVGRWIGLTLFELGRTDEAMTMLGEGLHAFPDHPDYAYLLAVVSPSTGAPVDARSAEQLTRVSGQGARYCEWFRDTPRILSSHLGAALRPDRAESATTQGREPGRTAREDEESAVKTTIPRTFHRIWLGPNRMPQEFEDYWGTWQEAHPGWTFRTWRDADLFPLINQSVFDAAGSWAQKADVLRYEILARHGGVYVDCDFECFKSIEPLLDGVDCFSASEDGQHVSIGIMGARPDHPWITRLISGIQGSVDQQPEAPPNFQTGPVYATRMFLDEEKDHRPVIFGPKVFYPYSGTEKHRRHESFPEAYAAHHWAESWMRTTPVRTAGPPAQDSTRSRLTVVVEIAAPLADLRLPLSALVQLFTDEDAVDVYLVGAGVDITAPEIAEPIGEMIRTLSGNPATLPEIVLLYPDQPVPAALLTVRFSEDASETATAVIQLTALAQEVWKGGAASDRPVERTGAGGAAGEGARPAAPATTATATQPHDPRATYVGNGLVLLKPAYGGKLYCLADDLSLTPELVLTGIYDPGLCKYLIGVTRRGDRCVDVGANVGTVTVLLGSLVGASGHVRAYEANPEVFSVLKRNVSVNYLDGWTKCFPQAVSSEPGTLVLHRSEAFRGNSSLHEHNTWYREHFSSDTFTRVDVPTVRLDDVIGAGERIATLKVDVEGAEEAVLRGAARLLDERRVDRVVFELVRARLDDEGWRSLSALLDRYRSAGWSFGVVTDTGDPHLLSLDELLTLDAVSSAVMAPSPALIAAAAPRSGIGGEGPAPE